MARQRRKPSPPEQPTVGGELAAARVALASAKIPGAWLDAEVLLAHVLKTRREALHTHPERAVTAAQHDRIDRFIARRAARVPIAYLTGEREFYGYSIRVTPAVLIPRPETELLVELAIAWLLANPQARRVIDLGTGSGAVAIAIAKAVPTVRVVASDIDGRALRVAAANVKAHRLASRITVVRRDLLEGARQADLVVANLPYLSAARRRAWQEELDAEPIRALDGGRDGLGLIRRALVQAPSVVHAGAALMFECDPGQPRTIARLALHLWPEATVTTHKDLAGRDRVVQIQL
jgi:release factor glutamine methyltransferase